MLFNKIKCNLIIKKYKNNLINLSKNDLINLKFRVKFHVLKKRFKLQTMY